MDLYEYQGKELFRRVGIPVSEGRLAVSPEEARAAASSMPRCHAMSLSGSVPISDCVASITTATMSDITPKIAPRA